MQLEAVMTKLVYTCGPEESLRAAARIMWDHDCGCVPIVDRTRRLLGIITDRDIAVTAHLRGLSLEDVRIGEVMQAGLVSCARNESVARAMDKMQKFQVHRLPVIDESGRLTGLITLNDLAVEAERQHAKHGFELSHEEVGQTLAAIGTHRPAVWRSPCARSDQEPVAPSCRSKNENLSRQQSRAALRIMSAWNA